MVKLLDNIAERIPNFAGIKHVTNDLGDFGRCLYKYGSRFALMYGTDEVHITNNHETYAPWSLTYVFKQQIMFGAFLGGTAFVGASFNVMGKIHQRMLNLCKSNDAKAASKEQMRIQLVTGVIRRDGKK